ncbi:MAG: iron-containing alcohol dehydrogenase [Synergistes sp.]|nr:iron-containing alcohol dehydrogenase [Synergistes sp.]
MRDFTFEYKTKVYFAKGAVKKYLSALMDGVGKNVLLCYGGGSIKRNGVYEEVMAVLSEAGKNVTEFCKIMPNPTYNKVLEGAAAVKAHNIDFILAVGGGSVMDCAKAVSMAAVYKGDLWHDFWARYGTVDFVPIPVGVILTLSGTGSEVNGDAVITNTKEMVKTGHNYPSCAPQFALIDPTYTFSVPRSQLAAGGFDSLSHVMEAYFSRPDSANISDGIAEVLMRTIIQNLRVAMKDNHSYEAMSNLIWASSMAETMITKLGKECDFECHKMEHVIGAYTNCRHGDGLAVLHPTYYRHIYMEGLAKFEAFARNVWGVERGSMTREEHAQAGIDALESFIKELGLPAKLSDICDADEEMLAKAAASCEISQGSYKIMTHNEILQIFYECM